MTEEQALDFLREELQREKGTDPAKVTLGAYLTDDLDLDSLDQVELIMKLEDRFHITVPEDAGQKMETVGGGGSGKDIAFLDFGYYLIGDRMQMRAESSMHAQFTTDQTVFRIIERVDGRGWIQSAITPRKGSATLSPFVTLDERG